MVLLSAAEAGSHHKAAKIVCFHKKAQNLNFCMEGIIFALKLFQSSP